MEVRSPLVGVQSGGGNGESPLSLAKLDSTSNLLRIQLQPKEAADFPLSRLVWPAILAY